VLRHTTDATEAYKSKNDKINQIKKRLFLCQNLPEVEVKQLVLLVY
jgi:hypothetical protein